MSDCIRPFFAAVAFLLASSAIHFCQAETPVRCTTENNVVHFFYEGMSKCVEGVVIDRDADLCHGEGNRKAIFFPSTQRCLEGHVVPKEMQICNVTGSGKVPYYPSTTTCCDGALVSNLYACPSQAAAAKPGVPSKTEYIVPTSHSSADGSAGSGKVSEPAVCPLTQPDLADGPVSLYSHYQKYIKPIQSYSASVLQGEFALANVKEIYEALNTQYAILQSTLRNPVDVRQFVESLSGLYRGQGSLATLNSTTAKNIPIEAGGSNFVISMLKNGTACVAPSAANPRDYTLNLYAMKWKDCINLMSYRQNLLAKNIQVNGRPVTQAEEVCARDAKGERTLSSYFLQPALGQNQVTLTYAVDAQ